MDDTGNVTKDGKEDVDQEICAAATLKEHTKRREDDGKNNLDDVAEDCISYDSSPSLAGAPRGSAGVSCAEGKTHDPVKAILKVV